MRTTTILALLAALLLAPAAGAEERGLGGYVADVGQKAASGLANVLWAPTELVTTPVGFMIDTGGHAPYYPVYAVVGTIYGVFSGVWRAVDGALDLVTAPYAPAGIDRWERWSWVSYPKRGRPLTPQSTP